MGARASRVLFHFPCFFLSLFFMARYGALRFLIDEYSNHATNLTPSRLVSHFPNEISHHLHRFNVL